MTSLAELRAIEEERIAAERAAIVAEADARRRAVEDAERRVREATEARAAAERAEEIRIAREREQAEREARMHVEAAEAAERARHAAALEQERTAQELELRRQEVAKKRPTWMVAVTIAAVAAAAGLTWFGFDRYQQAQAAKVAEDDAKAQAAQARKEADEAAAELARMHTELAELDGKVQLAIDRIVAANDAAAREQARKDFERLRKQEAELQAKRDAIAAKIAHDKRVQVIKISEECKKNPLAKGCM